MPSLNPIGQPFIELLTVESTNNYAMGLARAGMAQHGTVVFTHEQTKGKGQRGKQWVSEAGQNLAMSVVLDPQDVPPRELFLLSMMAAISVRQVLAACVDEHIKIKWPNDIYWRDRKAAGILIENVWQGKNWKCAVVGIGINVNQNGFGALASKAVSLKQITGKNFSPLALAKDLCVALETNYQLFLAEPRAVRMEYKSHLYRLNETVRLMKDNRAFEALIKDVSDKGELVVQHGVEERFEVGEVEWIIASE